MNEKQEPNPDLETLKSRIVRELYDVVCGLAHRADAARAAELRRTIAEITSQADALGDADFSAAFRAALRHLLPDDAAGGTP